MKRKKNLLAVILSMAVMMSAFAPVSAQAVEGFDNGATRVASITPNYDDLDYEFVAASGTAKAHIQGGTVRLIADKDYQVTTYISFDGGRPYLMALYEAASEKNVNTSRTATIPEGNWIDVGPEYATGSFALAVRFEVHTGYWSVVEFSAVDGVGVGEIVGSGTFSNAPTNTDYLLTFVWYGE